MNMLLYLLRLVCRQLGSLAYGYNTHTHYLFLITTSRGYNRQVSYSLFETIITCTAIEIV